ncbi:MAG: DsrE/DsrF/DrsH-like family protein [Bacillota bacterium]
MSQKLNLLMFSGDYDKTLAALILADSALAMDMDVTMFFAFWGLLAVRDPQKNTDEDKSLYEKIFNKVTAEGVEKLPLSRMNLSGFGKLMLQEMMEDADSPTLSDLLNEAREKGAKFYGCKLSVKVMGFNKEELIPEIEIIEAQDYLQDALNSEIKLFI